MSFSACLLALALAALPAPVAHAVAGTKTVTVVRAGKSLPVAVDMALFRTDLLQVPSRGFLLVKVDKNELVVRIDEELELLVSDIAVLDAEKHATSSWSDQVNQLLTPQERDQRGTPRMVGWFVSPTAANVPTSIGLKDAPPATARDEKADDEQPPDKSTKRVAVVPAPPPPPPPPATVAPASPSPRNEAGPSANSPAPRSAGPPIAQSSERRGDPGATGNVQQPAPPKQDVVGGAARAPGQGKAAGLEAVPVDAQLRACVEPLLAPLGADVRGKLGATLLVKVRRSSGAVRVFIEGALPVDACVRAWAEAKPNLTEQWQSIEVPLQ